jgi:hypothetical protein
MQLEKNIKVIKYKEAIFLVSGDISSEMQPLHKNLIFLDNSS